MAQLVVAAAGAAVGFMVGGPVGAQWGFALGSAAGGALFAPKQPSAGGSRLQDLRVTGTEYGQSIPWVLGAPRIAGQIWWASDKREISHSQSAGKGGGGQTVTSYTYEVDLLIGLTDGPIDGVTRVWLNGKLIWTNLSGATDASRIASEGTEVWSRLTIYKGSSTQLPEPTYEAAVGAANAPAYRGRSYIFIDSLQLGSSGQIPNLTFETSTSLHAAATITRRTANGATSPRYAAYSPAFVGAGYPAIVALTPNVRVAVLSTSDATVYQYQLDGTALSSSTRTGAAEQYPGPQAQGSSTPFIISYPVGILGGRPVRVQMMSTAFGAGHSILVVGTQNGSTSGTGELSGYDLGSVLPAGEFCGGITLCCDGTHAIIYTAPSNATSGSAVVNKWYLIDYDGSTASLIRSGTLAAAVSIYSFGFGNSATFHLAVSMLEENLTNLWVAYTPGGIVYLYTIDAGGVLAQSATLAVPNGLLTNGFDQASIWAESGFCVVVYNDDFCTFRRGGDSIVTVPLASAVSALCTRAGLTAGQFDVSALASITRPVRALAIAQVGPTRSALEQLQTAYQFEAVLSDKLYFRPRGGAAVLTIPYTDLGASSAGVAQEQPLPLTIASDLELPPQVAVQYLNDAADQQTATEVSDRLIAGQAALSTVQIGLSLQPTEAKAVADAIVADQLAGLVTTTLKLPLQYAHLEPSDVVQVTGADGALHRLRLVKRDDAGGLLSFDAVADDAQAIVSAGITSSSYLAAATVTALGDTTLIALDIPLLRDADDTPGYYVAATGTTTNWPGCVVMSSSDGTTYAQAAAVDESAVLGSAATTLGSWTGGVVMDERNALTVNVGNGQLSSVTRDALLADRTLNALLVGSEIVRFATATLVTANPNVYTLTRLLRGQQGTDWASTGHAASERVVLLGMRGLRRVAQQSTDVGRARTLKGVTNGKMLAAAAAASFINSGVSAKPWAPVDLRGERSAWGDMVLSWKRRTRRATTFAGASGITVPLGESSERYEVEIWDAGFVNRKAVQACTSAQLTYTSAAQVADFGAIQSHIYARVYQLNSTGARGYVLSGMIEETYSPIGQTSTITLTGTFAAGVLISVYAGPVLLAAYTSVAGDTNLAGIATALAAAVNGVLGYSAAPTGAAVAVTGPVGVAYVLSAIVGGGSWLGFNVVQPAALANAGQPYAASLAVANFITGVTEPVPSGVVFSLAVERPAGVAVGSISHTTVGSQTRLQILAGLASALAAHATLPGLGYSLTVASSALAGNYGAFGGPVGAANINLVASGSAPYTLSVSVQTLGALPVPVDQAQIVDAAIGATPAAGEIFSIVLDGTAYSYTAAGGDTAVTVAAALATTIDATANYAAAPVDLGLGLRNARITRSAVATPFTYNGGVQRPLVATVT